MLNKVMWMTIVTSIFSAIRVFLPDLPLPVGLEEAIAVVITFVTGFFVKESAATVKGLTLK